MATSTKTLLRKVLYPNKPGGVRTRKFLHQRKIPKRKSRRHLQKVAARKNTAYKPELGKPSTGPPPFREHRVENETQLSAESQPGKRRTPAQAQGIESTLAKTLQQRGDGGKPWPFFVVLLTGPLLLILPGVCQPEISWSQESPELRSKPRRQSRGSSVSARDETVSERSESIGGRELSLSHTEVRQKTGAQFLLTTNTKGY